MKKIIIGIVLALALVASTAAAHAYIKPTPCGGVCRNIGSLMKPVCAPGSIVCRNIGMIVKTHCAPGTLVCTNNG